MARVLVSEDEAITSMAFALALSRAGHDVKTAASAETAFAISRSFKPDVLVTDFKLRKSDGVSLASSVLDENPLTQAILVSATIDAASSCAKVKYISVFEFLEKPCRPEEVVTCVTRALKIAGPLSARLPQRNEDVEGQKKALPR